MRYNECMKRCYQCKLELSVESFWKLKRSKDGLQPNCKECGSKSGKICYYKNQANRIKRSSDWQKQKNSFIASLKNKPCIDCGARHHYSMMDFDHIDNNKVMNVSKMRNKSMDTLLAEIKKCELVCSNCHRLRTWIRMAKRNGIEV